MMQADARRLVAASPDPHIASGATNWGDLVSEACILSFNIPAVCLSVAFANYFLVSLLQIRLSCCHTKCGERQDRGDKDSVLHEHPPPLDTGSPVFWNGPRPFANWIVESLRFNGVHVPISQGRLLQRRSNRRRVTTKALQERFLHAVGLRLGERPPANIRQDVILGKPVGAPTSGSISEWMEVRPVVFATSNRIRPGSAGTAFAGRLEWRNLCATLFCSSSVCLSLACRRLRGRPPSRPSP